MNPSDFEAGLRSLERSERMTAEKYDAAAESARDDLARLPEGWPQGWPEAEERGIRRRLDEAESRAATSRRRADHAAAGYLLMTDREHGDHEFMSRHQSLISHAHRSGRAKTTADCGCD
jgi:hypothetical protein